MVETTTQRLLRFAVSGGEPTVLATLPAYPDNMSAVGDGSYWIALPTSRGPRPARDAPSEPSPVRDRDGVPADPARYGGVVLIDGDGHILRTLWGLPGQYRMITGVRQHGNDLWLTPLRDLTNATWVLSWFRATDPVTAFDAEYGPVIAPSYGKARPDAASRGSLLLTPAKQSPDLHRSGPADDSGLRGDYTLRPTHGSKQYRAPGNVCRGSRQTSLSVTDEEPTGASTHSSVEEFWRPSSPSTGQNEADHGPGGGTRTWKA